MSSAGTRPLLCRVCGAGQAVSPRAREEGWFRCAHCDAPSSIEGGGHWVAEGPRGVVCAGTGNEVRVSVPPGRLASLKGFLLRLFLGDLALSAMLWILEEVGVRQLRVPLVAAAAVVAVVAFARLFVTQHLVIGRDGLRGWRALGPVRFRRRTASLRYQAGNPVLPRASEAEMLWIGERVTEVLVAGPAPLAAEVSCPGCGAPVQGADVAAAGGHTCPWCGSGFLVASGAPRLGEVVAPAFPVGPLPRGVTRSRDGDSITWTVSSAFGRWSVGMLFLATAVIWGGFCTPFGIAFFTVWGLPLLPLTKGFAAAAAAFVVLALFFGQAYALLSVYRFRLDATTFTQELHLFGRRVWTTHLPLVRLAALDTRGSDKTPQLTLRTPHRSLRSGLTMYGDENMGRLWAELVAALQATPVLEGRIVLGPPPVSKPLRPGP